LPCEARSGDRQRPLAAFSTNGATEMTRRLLVSPVLLLALHLAAYGDDKAGKAARWVGSVNQGTAGGSAVHETLFPGQPHEIISIYTADGPDLVMTHYCVLGNQPRLKADPKSPANQIHFQFAGGTNLDPKKDKHMHAATLTFVDDDHL